MKKNLFFIVLLSLFMYSCSNSNSEVAYAHELDYVPVSENYEEFCYLDVKTGKKVKNAQTYEWASYFYDNIAIVKKNGKYRFINKKFEFISSDEYSQVTIFNEGIAYAVKPSGLIEAINKQGKVIFALKEAEKAYMFKDGVSIFETEKNTFGIVNTKGDILFETENHIDACNKEIIKIAKTTNAGTKYGIVDYNNNEIIPCEYDNISLDAFSSKNKLFLVENNEKCGVINIKNKEIIPLEYGAIFRQLDGNYLFANVYKYGDIKFGWLNNKGEEIIEPQFEQAVPFIWGNLTPVKDSETGKIGYINKKGEWIIKPKYEYAQNFFENGLAIVENPNTEEMGAIDKSNEYVIKAKYDELEYLGYGLYYAEDDDKAGIINSKGDEVVKINDIYLYDIPFVFDETMSLFTDYDTYGEEYTFVYSEYLNVAEIVNDMMKDIQKLKLDSLTISQLENKFDVEINENFVNRWSYEILYESNNKYYTTTISTNITPIIEYSFYDGYQTTYDIEYIKIIFSLTSNKKMSYNETNIKKELAKKLGIQDSESNSIYFEQNIIPEWEATLYNSHNTIKLHFTPWSGVE